MEERSKSQWLLFEVANLRHALPVQEVAEVTEPRPTAAIPTVDPTRVRAVCHQGEPLPLLLKGAWNPAAAAAPQPPARHWIVIADESGTPQLALEADRVIGLAEPEAQPGESSPERSAASPSGALRRLSAEELLARARELIEGQGEDEARRDPQGGLS